MGASFKNVQQKSSSPPTISKKQSVQPSPRSPVASLQRCFGNQGYMNFIQAKLEIGQPNDKYEQEANRLANQVMRIPEPTIQPKST